MSSSSDLEKVLKAIKKHYQLDEPLSYDEISEDFVGSVCSYFTKFGNISPKQLNALVANTTRISMFGKSKKPTPKPLDLPKPDEGYYLHLNCKTHEAYWVRGIILIEEEE
jgi:hypothetical protein